MQFCYKYEKCAPNKEIHTGIIADDSPLAISNNHRSLDIGATASIALGGVKELDKEVEELKAENAQLRVGVVSHTPGIVERVHDFFFGT